MGLPGAYETRIDGRLSIGRDSSPEWLRKRFAQSGLDNLSRNHAVLEMLAGRVTVTDLGSSNGTYVNSVRIEANLPTALASGDLLRFAASLTVTVRSGGAA